MTSLAPLHRRLRRLVRRRRRLRWLAGLTPLGTAVLWFLLTAFLLDWLLEMNRSQRALLWLAGAAALGWAYRRYGWPWVRAKESELDMALLVERKAHVDTDVVAALQFESPEAPRWGSVQLEQAVMQQAVQLAPQLPMDEGLPRQPIQRRTVLLACTTVVVALLWAFWPMHVKTFLARLLLSNRHYPTRTQIQWVKINGQVIPADAAECWVVEGQPVQVQVLAQGELPPEGRMELSLRSTGVRTEAPLQGLFQERLNSSSRSAQQAEDSAAGFPPEKETIPPGSALYGGQMERLTDPAWMKIYLGDARTEPIHLLLTPLPRIELLMEVRPPDYAQQADVPKGRFPGLCQLAVVEGSQVQIHISADKRLQEAWVRIEQNTYPMQAMSASPAGAAEEQTGQAQWWVLPPGGTPLEAVVSPLQFVIQVKDEHNLTLEHPLQGFLRILPDLAPRVSAAQRTSRILPTAQPRIQYEAADDFGIGKVILLRQLTRSDGTSQEDEMPLYQIAPGEKPTKTRQAMVRVPLDSLGLKPGDQVRLVVRVEDYRGPRPGQVALSEPLVFQVTDLAGILAAITEADRQLVQEYQEMIDRQLEVGGEKP